MGLRVLVHGFGVRSYGICSGTDATPCSGCCVQGLGLGVWGVGFRGEDIRFGVQVPGSWVSSLKLRVRGQMPSLVRGGVFRVWGCWVLVHLFPEVACRGIAHEARLAEGPPHMRLPVTLPDRRLSRHLFSSTRLGVQGYFLGLLEGLGSQFWGRDSLSTYTG